MLGTFTATAGDLRTFPSTGLAFLGKAEIFTMWKASRDAMPGAVFELVMSGGSWDGHFRIV